MTTDDFVLEIPQMIGMPVAAKRKAQGKTGDWPAGTRIVSADSHMFERDCWHGKFPAELAGREPRVELKDGYFEFTCEGQQMTPPEISRVLYDALESNPGFLEVGARLKDLDIEGVEKELIFPQRLFGLYIMGQDRLREEIFSIYNEDIAARCAEGNGRLYAVMIPNYWDLSKSRDSIARIKQLGGRCLMLPNKPGKNVDGKPIHYNDWRFDPFWEAVSEFDIPLCFHIGEAIVQARSGAAGTALIAQMQGFRQQWGMLTFGGVFDRFPKLKVVFVEAGICWVASMLHDADMAYNSFPTMMVPKLAHPPSWYWRNHCYATFMTDPAGLELLHRIGPQTVMWSSDYPHQESTFGYTRSSIDAVFKATSVENAQMILGGTALKLFDMQ
ncbi:MAG TPA: amidohydrolase family protein [Rhizomicrobium sp.]